MDSPLPQADKVPINTNTTACHLFNKSLHSPQHVLTQRQVSHYAIELCGLAREGGPSVTNDVAWHSPFASKPAQWICGVNDIA
jgi:hypothetical protein